MQGIISFFPSLAQVNSFFRRVNVYKNSRSFAHASYVVKMYRVLPKGGTKGLLAPPQRAAVVASFTCINDIWYTCVWHADLQKSQLLQWPKPNRKSAILNLVLIAHVLLFIIITKLIFFKWHHPPSQMSAATSNMLRKHWTPSQYCEDCEFLKKGISQIRPNIYTLDKSPSLNTLTCRIYLTVIAPTSVNSWSESHPKHAK